MWMVRLQIIIFSIKSVISSSQTNGAENATEERVVILSTNMMLVFTDFPGDINALQVLSSLSYQGQKGWTDIVAALRAQCICFRNTSSFSSSLSFFTEPAPHLG